MQVGSRVHLYLALAAALAGAAAAGTPSALAMVTNPHNLLACTKCHRDAPQFGVDSRRTVSFTSSRGDPGLCTPCHATGQYLHPVGVAPGSGPAGARVSPYLTAAGDPAFAERVVCVSCHFIHAADGRHGLLRGFPGSPDPRYFPGWEDFCRECHGDNLVARSPHGGGDGACAYCHQAKPRPGKAPEVSLRDRSLCLLCHQDAQDTHGRDLNPRKGELDCVSCHDPHADPADRPGLLSAAFLAAAVDDPTIRPHYRRGLCLACHANVDDFELRAEDVNATCDRCHASGKIVANIHPLRVVPASIVPPKGWPLAGGALTCLTCHEQGHDDQEPTPRMLRGGPYARPRDVCRGCHTGLDLLSSTIHADINEGRNCDLCHLERPVVGRDKFDDVVLLADPDLLCLRCHDILMDERHHRGTDDREFDAEKVGKDLPLFNGRVICATCHNPHQLEDVNSRLRVGLEDLGICMACHQV